MITERLKLGIIFNFNPKWMGGIIYVLNLIKTLNVLDEQEKPEIILFYRPELKGVTDQIKYPYLQTVEWNFSDIYMGYLRSWVSQSNVFISDIIDRYNLDGLYPLHDYPVRTRSKTKLVCWYADLQHKYYPEFFSKRKIFERTQRINFILRNSNDLVVSSQAVADDFIRFFYIRDELRLHIFHFVSVIDDFSELNIEEVRKKYNLPVKYFMISNQFHKHKNHKVLLKALVDLHGERPDIHLAMTGRFPDSSHSPYMKELHSIILEHNLSSQISFLGIIPRNEQLLLMKHSQAVIQPSLFEGWSTVIEDAISLQTPVIASSLPVNIEQLGSAGIYFEPHDSERLADILYKFPDRDLKDLFYPDYEWRIKEAAKVFLQIFRV
jgi:glycosyltransferase involved in cell wall biosynthesis